MKLYATITSERASKGQGGNRELLIDLKIENPKNFRKRFAMLKLTNYEDKFELSLAKSACDWEVIHQEDKKQEKGNKQKGDK